MRSNITNMRINMPLFYLNEAKEDEVAFEIIMDYLRGVSASEIRPKLKTQTTKFAMNCNDRYKKIMFTHRYHVAFNDIMDELSIGGCQIHRSIEVARQNYATNCYVWENEQLRYINTHTDIIDLQLTIEPKEFEMQLRNLTPYRTPETVYLSPEKAAALIMRNTTTTHTHRGHLQKNDYLDNENLNVYSALKKLQDKHPHLALLLNLIDETKAERRWWLYLMSVTGLTAIAGLLFYLKDHIDMLKKWFDQALPLLSRYFSNTLYLLRSTPLIGIVSNGFRLINAWYRAYIDDSFSDSNKVIKLFFKTLEHALPIIGYMLCYAAAGSMTPIAMAMFITGAFIDVFQAYYTLNQHEQERRKNPPLPPLEYYSKAQNARANYLRELDRYVFYINFTTNLLITASVIIWCVFPPSLLIALPCMVFTSLVGMTKNALLTHIKDNYETALQIELENINRELDLEVRDAKASCEATMIRENRAADSIKNLFRHMLFKNRNKNSDRQRSDVYTAELVDDEQNPDNLMNYAFSS